MHAEVITIGGEILSGSVRDTNFLAIAARLADEGLALVRHTVVPDDREALGSVLAHALARSPVVLTSGGLGVTPDDVTRRVLASVLGRKLIFRDSLLEDLREKYRARGRQMNPAAEAMALIPSGAQPLANPVGMAPGLLLRTESSMLFALPGVPAELERMLETAVLPVLRAEGLVGRLIVETLRTVGIPETRLAERTAPLLSDGITAAYLPAAGRVDLRLSASGGDQARGEFTRVVARLAEACGPAIYARGAVTLEEALIELLRRARATVAVAESLTGGRVGGALTRVPGSSAVFLGGVSAYCDEAKRSLLGVSAETLAQHGAVSAPAAREMAAGIRRALGADVSIATSGIAGPGGATPEKPVGLVYFALSAADGNRAFRYRLGGDRTLIQEHAVTVALNLLRLSLIGRLDVAAPAAVESP